MFMYIELHDNTISGVQVDMGIQDDSQGGIKNLHHAP